MVQNRQLFAGSNGGCGFHSLFANIIEADFNRVYLLKGGPGTGKSSFMRSVADTIAQEGYEQEFFFCSSDPGSLDAVACPELGVALIDATHPHAEDATWPGCRDQLICLGDFWSAQDLAARREEIVAAGLEKQRHFQSAFRYFAAAKLMEDSLADRNAKRKIDCHQQVAKLVQLIQSSGGSLAKPRPARHLFASALTPKGFVSFTQHLVEHYSDRYVLKGPAGSGQEDYVEMIVGAAAARGLRAEVFHYPLNPEKLLHVLIPDLELAVLSATSLEPLHDIEAQTIKCSYGSEYGAENAGDQRLFRELLQLGTEALRSATAGHAKVEGYYIAAMDFAALDLRRDEVIEEILSYKNRS